MITGINIKVATTFKICSGSTSIDWSKLAVDVFHLAQNPKRTGVKMMEARVEMEVIKIDNEALAFAK